MSMGVCRAPGTNNHTRPGSGGTVLAHGAWSLRHKLPCSKGGCSCFSSCSRSLARAEQGRAAVDDAVHYAVGSGSIPVAECLRQADLAFTREAY